MKTQLKKFLAVLLAAFLLMDPSGFSKTKAEKQKDQAPDRPRVRKHTGRHYREARKYERRAKIKAEYERPPKEKPIKPSPKRQIRYPKDKPTPEPEDEKPVNGLVSLR